MKFIIEIYLIFITFLVITNAAEDKPQSQDEKVSPPLEVATSEPETKSEAKAQEKTEEKTFTSDEINIISFKNGTFANVSDCLYFYQRGGSLTLKVSAKNGSDTVHHLTFEDKPFKPKGHCLINSTHHQAYILLRFKLKNGTESAGNLRLNATFIKNERDSWELDEMGAKLTSSNKKSIKEFKLNSNNLETPMKFSYSCKKFSIESDRLTKDVLILNLKNLQIQPFYNGKVFADSFDCSTLFTLGSWMGIIVLWIFTSVTALGAYSLINIKTMDRFDNTKGKTIINVAAGDQ